MKYIFILFIILIILLIFALKYNEYFYEFYTFPKIIWTYWMQPDIPPIVQKCIETWEVHNPTYEIRILTRENLQEYIDVDIVNLPGNNSLARESDFVRLNILAKYGGFWIDASTICRKPFEWIQERSIEKQFFGYYIPNFTTDQRYPVIESWFFACIPESPFVIAWRDEFMRLNTFKTITDYVNDVKQNTDVQNIMSPEYLTIHVAAQKVLQNLGPWPNLEIISATEAGNGPFYYLQQTGWDSTKAIASLCEQETNQTTIIKFRGDDRYAAEQNMSSLDCIFSKI